MLLLGALGTTFAGEGENAPQELQIVAPECMTALCETLAAGFSGAHPEIRITVLQDKTAGGVECLAVGSCQVAAVARPVTSGEAHRVLKETGQQLVCVPIALDAVRFFVHPDTPIDKLDFAMLRRIYSGEAKMWDQLGVKQDLPIWRVAPPLTWGSTGAVERRVLSPRKMVLPSLVKPTGLEVISVAASDRRVLGFCGLGFERGIKVLPVARDASSEPVLPTREHVQTQTYPVTYYLYWCFAGNPTGQLRELLKYATGSAGQELIRAAEVGCVPLPIAPVNQAADAEPGDTTSTRVKD